MRVIGGEARGRSLRAPRGLQTRPTSDLMRGALFSIIDSMGIMASAVLDLYAGSGALGIEALSRGAERADFVEWNPVACAVIRQNLERAGFAASSHVICLSVERAIGRLDGPYNLIFVDPPYADHSVRQILSSPHASALWEEGTLLVYEHNRKDAPPVRLGSLELLRTRSHGSSSLSFYRVSQSADSAGQPVDAARVTT